MRAATLGVVLAVGAIPLGLSTAAASQPADDGGPAVRAGDFTRFRDCRSGGADCASTGADGGIVAAWDGPAELHVDLGGGVDATDLFLAVEVPDLPANRPGNGGHVGTDFYVTGVEDAATSMLLASAHRVEGLDRGLDAGLDAGVRRFSIPLTALGTDGVPAHGVRLRFGTSGVPATGEVRVVEIAAISDAGTLDDRGSPAHVGVAAIVALLCSTVWAGAASVRGRRVRWP